MNCCDLVVIGGGPAGYVPAIRAAQLGRNVKVIEEDSLGGTCLNRGCIPTKTLISSASLLRHGTASKRFGLEGSLSMTWDRVARRKDSVVTRLRKGIEAHFSHMGIELVTGHGILREPGKVDVDGREITAANILLAPGSLPLLPGPFAAAGVLSSRDVLAWDELPGSLLIVGGGVIGCEFASILRTFGVEVTIVEMLPDILPGIDSDVTEVVHRALTRSGVKILTGHGAESVSVSGGAASVTMSDGNTLEAETLLAAIGRKSRVSDLGLAEAGVELTAKGIACDGNQRTSLPGVYAAGDATGLWQLAHAGSAQALAAVDHMFGDGSRVVNPDAMPGCIFTFPEIATVGPGEDEWKTRGVEVRTGYARYIANGKAVGMSETEGFVKIITRASDDVVIGVQIVGADASSLVGEAVMAVNLGVSARKIGAMVHPHPTLSELFMEAAEALETAQSMDDGILDALARLLGIVRILRGPSGCRWDRKQTAASLRPYMLEEAYEVADAVDREDWEALGSELGDLLLHILMTSEICRDQGLFSIEDVATRISDKLVRRHPHVFDSPGSLSPEEVEKQWEAIKASEKGAGGFFSSIPASMPSLQTAWRIQQRAAEMGFQWQDPEGAREKMREELQELELSLDQDDRPSQEEELGDLLFSLVNYCRMTGFEPEMLLRRANVKFMNRFREMEVVLTGQGQTLQSASLEQMIEAWDTVRRDVE